MKPAIRERFADNGAHSHWSVIDAETGATIIEDIMRCTEPTNPADADRRVKFCSFCGMAANDICSYHEKEAGAV